MRQARRLSFVLLSLAAAAAVYLSAGLIGAAWVTNRDWRPPAEGVTIWIEDNGIHTDLVMPKQAAGVDWRRVFGGGALREPAYAGFAHVAVGWGERGFFVNTPTWWDLRPGTVIAAAVGSEDTVLHVEHVPRPVEGERVRAVVLTPAEYRRLARVVRGSLAAGEPVRGYAGYDAFYPAHGRYDLLNTCNAWTGRALRRAGVRVGRWTPFSATVSWWL
ncbi:TIGR02117 family protein [Sphingomonas sp.]|uniref:TIGR02117 family protein n=1 Tax=Sphingomonas sp. TaxID=28214 RepID=UPI0035C83C7F